MTTKPIWHQQKNETEKQHCLFILFLEIKEPITIPEFYQRLIENGKKMENGYRIPTLKYMQNLASDKLWIKRKKAYQKNQNKELLEEIEQEDLRDKKEIFRLNQKIKKKGLNKAINLLDADKYSGYHFMSTMQGIRVANEENRLTLEKPTDIIQSENKNIDIIKELDKTNSIEDILDWID